ncbi:MAG: LytTR family DNA-binding domain-containing protein, partial [Bacteroidetes bacterium]|nr:LytTR family DNA-binding domain-containing protein [Bacteroidota bacterium]
QFAIQAIRHSAIDYIMKPVDNEEFVRAVNKSKQMNLNIDLLTRQVKVLLKNKDNFHRIALPTLDGLRFIDLDEVLYCKSESNYTWFHLQNGEKIMVTRTLKEYDETLSENRFIRIHQSYLINIRYVDRYLKGKSAYVVMSNGQEINVSRRKEELFLKKMEQR